MKATNSDSHTRALFSLTRDVAKQPIPFAFSMAFYVLCFSVIYALYLASFTQGSYVLTSVAGMLMGAGLWLVSAPFHYYSHTEHTGLRYALSSIGTCYSMDYWHNKHVVQHHSFTNEAGADEDISILRMLHRVLSKTAFIPTILVLTFLYSLLLWKQLLVSEFVSNRLGSMRAVLSSILVRSLHLFFFAIVPYLLSESVALTALGYYCAGSVLSLLAATIFQLAHCGSQQKIFSFAKNSDFAVRQLETTADFGRQNGFLTWFTGGLNHQIEHHLFPRLHPYHLIEAGRRTKKYCEQHSLPYYEHATTRAAILDHLVFMKGLKTHPYFTKPSAALSTEL